MPGPATKLRPYNLAPRPDDTQSVADFYNWVQTSLNALIGQQVPPASGLPGLNPPTVDPTSSILASAGSRITSLTTKVSASAPSTTQIHIWWDGSNSSQVLRIYRDDNTIAGPFPGNQLVTGLTANTLYFFFMFFDESSQFVRFVSQAGATGTPPIAYTASSPLLLQQQTLRGRVPISQLGIIGFSTPNAGTTPGASQGGGGGGGGIYHGSRLS
jgi:hypothetical protein